MDSQSITKNTNSFSPAQNVEKEKSDPVLPTPVASSGILMQTENKFTASGVKREIKFPSFYYSIVRLEICTHDAFSNLNVTHLQQKQEENHPILNMNKRKINK